MTALDPVRVEAAKKWAREALALLPGSARAREPWEHLDVLLAALEAAEADLAVVTEQRDSWERRRYWASERLAAALDALRESLSDVDEALECHGVSTTLTHVDEMVREEASRTARIALRRVRDRISALTSEPAQPSPSAGAGTDGVRSASVLAGSEPTETPGWRDQVVERMGFVEDTANRLRRRAGKEPDA